MLAFLLRVVLGLYLPIDASLLPIHGASEVSAMDDGTPPPDKP